MLYKCLPVGAASMTVNKQKFEKQTCAISHRLVHK